MFFEPDPETGEPVSENFIFSHFRQKIEGLVNTRLRGRVPLDDRNDIICEIHQALLTSLRKGSYNSGLGKPLEAYVAGISANIIGQYFRKQKRERIKINIDLYRDIESPANILSDIIENERTQRFEKCLERIKPKYREILLQRYYENKTIQELSLHLKLERRRVSERINYAVKLLLKEIIRDKYFS